MQNTGRSKPVAAQEADRQVRGSNPKQNKGGLEPPASTTTIDASRTPLLVSTSIPRRNRWSFSRCGEVL
jgi:hypothetical protein